MKTAADLYNKLIELEEREMTEHEDLVSPFIKNINWADYGMYLDWSSTKPRFGWEELYFKSYINDTNTKTPLVYVEHELEFQNIENKPCFVPGRISSIEILPILGVESGDKTFLIYGDEQ